MPEHVHTHAARDARPSRSPLGSHRRLLPPVLVEVRDENAPFVVNLVADVGGRALHA
jgi:hypothetical protein